MKIRFLAASVLALCLSGCQQLAQVPYINAQSVTPNQSLKVVPVSYQFNINLGRSALVASDRTAMLRFLRSHGPIDNQKLVVIASSRRQRTLATWLGEAGVQPNQLRWQVKGSQPGAVVLITEYFKVQTPDCPNWQGGQNLPTHAQQRSSNFGCATAANLAVMVRDPRELLKGRSLGAVSSDKMLSAMGRYLAPAEENTSTNNTNGSSGGQQ